MMYSALAPALSVQLPDPAGAIFVGLMLVGFGFVFAAVVVAWRGRGGGEKDGGK